MSETLLWINVLTATMAVSMSLVFLVLVIVETRRNK